MSSPKVRQKNLLKPLLTNLKFSTSRIQKQIGFFHLILLTLQNVYCVYQAFEQAKLGVVRFDFRLELIFAEDPAVQKSVTYFKSDPKMFTTLLPPRFSLTFRRSKESKDFQSNYLILSGVLNFLTSKNYLERLLTSGTNS